MSHFEPTSSLAVATVLEDDCTMDVPVASTMSRSFSTEFQQLLSTLASTKHFAFDGFKFYSKSRPDPNGPKMLLCRIKDLHYGCCDNLKTPVYNKNNHIIAQFEAPNPNCSTPKPILTADGIELGKATGQVCIESSDGTIRYVHRSGGFSEGNIKGKLIQSGRVISKIQEIGKKHHFTIEDGILTPLDKFLLILVVYQRKLIRDY